MSQEHSRKFSPHRTQERNKAYVTERAIPQHDREYPKQEARIDEFNTALSKICDGFPVFDSENQYLIALRELLKYTMQDQYDYIGWWLYEAPDAGYTVWWDDEDGKEIRVDLTEPGALYDYLVEYAAPEGVQEDEL